MTKLSRGYEWRQTRQRVIERDDHSCVGCGITSDQHDELYGRDIEVHHKAPCHIFVDDDGNTYEEFAHHEKNLVTLCHACHQRSASNHGFVVGITPLPNVYRRYVSHRPRDLTNTEFMEELLDAYECRHETVERVLEPTVTLDVDVSHLAAEIAQEMADKYVGIDEADLAGKIANDVERRLQGWSY